MKKKLWLTCLLAASLLAAPAHAAGAGINPALANDPAAFINQPAVKPRLLKLMGLVNSRFLLKNFGTVSTLQSNGGVIAVTGCRPHACGEHGSLVVYDQAHDAFKVWLTVSSKTHVFQDKAWVTPKTLNRDVNTYIKQMKP